MGIGKFKGLGRFALISGCIALLLELSIIPVVRTLPEAASFWSLWFLIALSIVFASIAIFIGGAQFRMTRSKIPLLAFGLGALVYVMYLAYMFVWWLVYL
jgi:hypothetical protein